MKFSLFIFLISSPFVFANTAFIPKAKNLTKGGKEFSFGFEAFQTTSVVDDRGQAVDLLSGESYQRLNIDFGVNYGFTDELQGLFSVRGRAIQARDVFESGETADYNQINLESALIGFQYGFKEQSGVKYTLEGSYRFLLNESERFFPGIVGAPAPDTINMGDTSRVLSLGFHAYSRSRSNNFFTASVFFRDPSIDLSSEIFSRVDYNLSWKYFSVGLGVENNHSLENDSFGTNPENKPQVYNGPSEYFNSVNRSWTAPYLQANLSFGGRWRIESRFAQVVTGNSTDIGPRLSLAFVKRIEKDEGANEFKRADSAFKQYKVEGLVTKVSKKRTGCLIDKGLVAGVEVGERVDFFFFDYIEGNQLIASGKVIKVEANRSVVRIQKRFAKKRVENGIIARIKQLIE